MKVSKEQLQKIIKEELEQMQEEGQVDEAFGTFLKSLGAGVGDVAKSAVSGVSGAISAAKEASKKADEEAEKARQEAKLAADKVKTESDVEAVIKTALKQVTGAVESLNVLMLKMKDLNMSVKESGLDLPMVLQQLKTARSALFHGGKKSQPLPKGQGPKDFQAGDNRPEAPIRGARIREDEQE
jgi:hypothetical protein